jgi:Ca2+-binding EF-hand superfamily protein
MKMLLIGGAALALAFPALAQVGSAPAAGPQARMAHKVQTRADLQAKVAEHFARLDTNRDGVLTQAEADAGIQALKQHFEQRRGQWREQSFERLDTNRDGAISRAEWDAAQTQRQQRMANRDRDGDGQPDGHRMGAMGGMAHGGMHGFGGQMFTMADTNHDGRVTLAEAQAAALQHFDMVDTNHDGQISPDERMQMHQRMKGDRRG